jgi:Ca2+-binding EF-hand superfamily protein
MAGSDTDREEGVDFTDLVPVLEELTYPVTKSEFVEEHGDRTIDRTNAEPISVRALYEDMGEETFESTEAVRQSILNYMPRDSVGRARYSDRGGPTPAERARSEDSL